MPQRYMFEAKGILATVVTAISGAVAWLPQIESLMRIGVSMAGIYAGIYAARYWHLKANEVKARRKKPVDDEETTT